MTVYLINAQKGPLANTKVRQALNYAVDKDKIIKELYKGYAIPIGSGIPNTDFGYNAKIKPYPYDPGAGAAAPGRGRIRRTGSTSTSRAATASTSTTASSPRRWR